MSSYIVSAVLPLVLTLIISFGFFSGTDVFSSFTEGAKEGIESTLKVLPSLLGLVMAAAMVRASGLLEIICAFLSPAAELLGISSEIVPLILLRPISGSGAQAYLMNILNELGPDSENGKIASIICAASDTTFYAVAVYFGSANIKKLRHTIPAALFGDLISSVFAMLTVKLLG